jgi:hypothetical protein
MLFFAATVFVMIESASADRHFGVCQGIQVTFKPKGKPRREGTRDFLTVEQGSVCIESGKDRDDLAEDDSTTYGADLPQAIGHTGNRVALVFSVLIYR